MEAVNMADTRQMLDQADLHKKETVINKFINLIRPTYNDYVNISYWSLIKITGEGILKGMKHSAPIYAKGKLVDIGCGFKPYKSIFDPYVNSYFGIDYKETADANYGSNTKADLYVDCTETGMPSESFDTLLSTQVMEHIYDTKKYIFECHRLLKKGGKGIFTIPQTWQCHGEPYDFYRFTKFSIENLFKEYGFKIIELKPLNGAYSTVIQTKIVSVYFRETSGIFFRLVKAFRFFFIIPVLNYKALLFDKLFWNDKLCLNYLLVVEKVK